MCFLKLDIVCYFNCGHFFSLYCCYSKNVLVQLLSKICVHLAMGLYQGLMIHVKVLFSFYITPFLFKYCFKNNTTALCGFSCKAMLVFQMSPMFFIRKRQPKAHPRKTTSPAKMEIYQMATQGETLCEQNAAHKIEGLILLLVNTSLACAVQATAITFVP